MKGSTELGGISAASSVSRQELYDLAWQKPMLRVAEQFGVSSSYLARVYTELKMPRPARGYWARREAGESLPKPELPPSRSGDMIEWNLGASIGTAVRSQKSCESIVEPKPHPLLAGVKPLFLKTRKVESGILRPYKRKLVDIMSSEARLDDALAAAQALFDGLAKHGLDARVAAEHMNRAPVELRSKPTTRPDHRTRWSPERPTVVYVGNTAIGLTLFEMTEEVETVYAGGKYLRVRDLTERELRRYVGPCHWRSKEECPSGRLCLQAYCPSGRVEWTQRWEEARAGSFKELVKTLVAAAPDIARRVHEDQLKADEEERQWELQRQRWKQEEERQRNEKAHHDSHAELMSAIASWAEVRRIHDFFRTVEEGIDRLPLEDAGQIRTRLRLCRELVGDLDPLALLRRWKSPGERLGRTLQVPL